MGGVDPWRECSQRRRGRDAGTWQQPAVAAPGPNLGWWQPTAAQPWRPEVGRAPCVWCPRARLGRRAAVASMVRREEHGDVAAWWLRRGRGRAMAAVSCCSTRPWRRARERARGTEGRREKGARQRPRERAWRPFSRARGEVSSTGTGRGQRGIGSLPMVGHDPF
jgi:hypothetical protein